MIPSPHSETDREMKCFNQKIIFFKIRTSEWRLFFCSVKNVGVEDTLSISAIITLVIYRLHIIYKYLAFIIHILPVT